MSPTPVDGPRSPVMIRSGCGKTGLANRFRQRSRRPAATSIRLNRFPFATRPAPARSRPPPRSPIVPPHLARPDAPQSPARRQLRLGHRRDVRSGLSADARGVRAPSRRSRRPPLQRAPARLDPGRAAGFHRASRRPRRSRPGRDRRRRLVRARPRRAPGARSGRPARSDGRRARASVRPTTTRRLARRARLGTGPADLARDVGLSVDGPRRRPLPGRGDPRGEPLGSVYDRRPGQGPDGLRHGTGAPLPDPVRGGRRRHRLSPRPRHRSAATGSERWATTARSSAAGRRRSSTAGARAAGSSASSRLSTQNARLADDDDAVGLARRPRLDRPGLRPDGLVRRDGRMGPAGRRSGRVHPGTPRRRRAAPSRGALAARRDLAQLPGQVPRGQRHPQADAPGERPRRRRCRRGRPATPPSTTCSPASRTTATGTGCSAGSTWPICGWRHCSA